MKSSHKISRFLILAAFVAVFVSCNGFFNKPDNPKQNKAEAGFTYVRILTESQSAARTVMPQDYNPTAETLTNYKLTTTFKAGNSEVEDAENSYSGLTYDGLTGIQLKLRNDKEYAFTLTAEYKGSSWSGTDTWSFAAPKEMLVFVLSQSMEGTGTLSLNADVSAAGISTSIKTVKIWISDERSIDRNVQSPAKIFNYSEANPCPEHIEYSEDVNPCGKRWMLMEITDNYDLTTVVGPELAYVYPNETTSWTPVIEVLNKKYKITFSREGFEVNNKTGRADKDVKITADLVPGAEFPEPYVQGIYEATRDLPNYDNELEIQDLFLPPTGYIFYRWWDGETLAQGGNPKGYEGGLPINGGTYTDDITLYPLWIKNGYIYNYSTKEEIEAYITAQSQDETYDIISIDFPEEFESSAVWNATISALNNSSLNQSDKKVSLNLSHLDIDWLEENVWFDRESPDESTTFASIAGTDEEPNTWLSVITLPQSRSKIPAYAFYNCTALESISIPTNYTEIGAKAFYNCSVMTTVNFNESSTFNPSKIQAIGDSAFIGTAITAISIPNSVTTIGANAFNGCTALETVTLANASALATIGESAFENTSITQIFLRAKVATIGDSAFKNCTKLANVSINSAAPLTSIGANAFEGCAFTEVTIPNSVTTIGDSAFSGCTSLAKVTIDSTASKLKTIGQSAFEGCAFTTISLPSTITTLGGRAFAGNSNLRNDFFTQLGTDWWYHYDDSNKELSAYSPGEVKFILNGESSEIPSTLVKAAPAEAIKESDLVSMVELKTMESGHFNLAFSGEIASVSDLAPLQNLTVGAEGATIGLDLSQVTITGTGSDLELPEKFFAGYSEGSYSSNSIIYDDSNSLNPIGKVLKSISLPEGLESLGSYAIGCCPKLETVVIPKSVKSLGRNSIGYNNSLKSISFEENSCLKNLYALALAYTPSLEKVGTGTTSVLPESLENVYQQVFLYSGITEITIPDNAVFTSDKVFQECSKLKTVTIGAKVDKLVQCFQGCTSLETVTINGTESDWFCVTKEEELHVYNQTVEPISSADMESKVNKENATYRDGKYYRNSTLEDVLSKTVSTMNSLSQTQYNSSTRYTTMNLTISVPFTSWETDLVSLKNISYANGSTSTTAIDLSGSTDNSPEKKIPDEFMKGKEWLSSFKMPQGTTTIGKQAFFGKDDNSNHVDSCFTEFVFNDDITTIEEEAFLGSYLKGRLTLPHTITGIGAKAFCRTMTLTVTFEDSEEWNLSSIPDYCFFRSGNDASLPLYIPASVNLIGKNAFVESLLDGREISLGDATSNWTETFTNYDETSVSTDISADDLKNKLRLVKQDFGNNTSENDHAVLWNDVYSSDHGGGLEGKIKSYLWTKKN